MKISVIIPYHNTDYDLFKLCMRSVLSQSFSEFEVIIVNDGSRQEYLSILEDVRNADRRIRIIHQECQGASNARNRGVKEAKGEYIAFVDADDMITVSFLQDAMDVMVKSQSDLVIGGVKFVYRFEDMNSGFTKKTENTAGEYRSYSGDEIENLKIHLASSRKLIKYEDGNIDRGPVARLIPRELALGCPFHEDLVMWEDLVWNLELLNQCKKVAVVPKTWYLYYQNPKSQIHRYRENVVLEVEETMQYMEKLLDLTKDRGYETFGDHVYDNLRRIYNLYYGRRECPLSKREMWEAYWRIYHSFPWSVFGTHKYYGMTNGKNKLMSLCFRLRIFFPVYGAKERIKNGVGKIPLK